MSAITCPSCNATVPAKEVEDGWCESCGKKLPAFVLSRTSTEEREQRSKARKDQATKKPSAARRIGLIVGGVIGATINSFLMVGPLRDAGYLITFGVGFVILVITLSAGRAVGGLFSKDQES